MANIAVTGGAGFIGANFVRHWHQQHAGDTIVVLDVLTYAGNRANLAGIDGVVLLRADIRDEQSNRTILVDHRIDTLVHFAAESHVDRSIDGPDEFILTNVLGTHALLKAAKFAWLDRGTGVEHRFHHVSTDEVFGSLGSFDAPFSEESQFAPNSPYSASKAASDHLVRAYDRTYGLQSTVSHCSNNYGPYQFPEKLIPLFILNALRGKSLPIYGDGLNVRDWLHVDDHCLAIELILAKGKAGESYNIGGGAELSNIDVVDRICAAVDAAFDRNPALAARFPDAPAAIQRPTSSLKVFVTDRAGHDRRYAIDEAKSRADLGYSPKLEFSAGLGNTLEWYLENETWWRAVLDGSYRK